ncbi:MAG: GNAT family N-acetyltransferase [Syntrophales bacterium]|nr:GNAT family N-acetyltransferase [Syntrophales bacterium]
MIRPITEDDREPVLMLLKSTGVFRHEEIQVAMELVDRVLVDGPASGYEAWCLVGDNSNIHGYICFGPVPMTDSSFDLYWIAVDPEKAGQGLGAKMMARMESVLAGRGGRKIFIETSSTPPYEPAKALYGKCGYSLKAVLEDFYRPGDHKLVYAKDINIKPR